MRIFVLVLILVAIACGTWCQEQTEPVFVTRLKVQVEGPKIAITWKDPSTSGVNLVYRHTAQLSRTNLANAEMLSTVEFGVESYVDIPSKRDSYYYAVLVRDTNGKVHEVFIAFRNITTVGYTVEKLATEEELATKVTELASEVRDGAVVVSFLASSDDRDLLVFRTTSPIVKQEDLLRSVSPVVLDGSAREYRDYVIAGIGYYYAVVDANLYRIGAVKLTPGQNTTRAPVSVPLEAAAATLPSYSAVRPLPLPFLQISSGVEFGTDLVSSSPFFLPDKKSVRPATSKAIARILERISRARKPDMTVEMLAPERAMSAHGESATLLGIVQKHLVNRKFQESRRLLEEFLDTHREPETEARAFFYLAQVHFFLNDYREAFFTLLLAQDHYRREVERWIDACLQKLIGP